MKQKTQFLEFSTKIPYNPLMDISFWMLLCSNLYAIFLFYQQSLTNIEIILIFLCQSIFIGIFQYFSIKTLENISVSNIIYAEDTASNKKTKITTSSFFLIHYFGLTVGYVIFALVFFGQELRSESLYFITSGALFFLASHTISYIRKRFFIQRKEGLEFKKKNNVVNLFYEPYARVVPMHAALLIGVFTGTSNILILFVFKIIIDLYAHVFRQIKLHS